MEDHETLTTTTLTIPLSVAKALAPYVHPDPSRYALSTVRVTASGATRRYEATDGHTAIQITTGGHPPEDGIQLVDRSELRTVIASKGHYQPTPSSLRISDYPDVDRAVPTAVEDTTVLDLDIDLVSRVAATQKALTRRTMPQERTWRVSLSGSLGPVVLTPADATLAAMSAHLGLTVTECRIVIMPVFPD